jgi:hypothetical protein
MEMCADGHDQIVYEGGRNVDCPMCVLIAEHKDAVGELNDKIADLEAA